MLDSFKSTPKPILARYSPIAPIAILERLQENKALGGYLLLLGHDVIQHYDRYVQLLKSVRQSHPDTFVIMDNSAVERAEQGLPALTPNNTEFLDVIYGLKADCYVMPDVMGNGEATIDLIEEYLTDIRSLHAIPMYVPQGKDAADLLASIQYGYQIMADIGKPHEKCGMMWGVPRIITNTFGSRAPTVQTINQLYGFEGVSIHLLGMSKNYGDDMRCTSFHSVIGIDSANPMVLGQLGEGMMSSKHLPRGNYWQDTELAMQSLWNIENVKQRILDNHPGITR